MLVYASLPSLSSSAHAPRPSQPSGVSVIAGDRCEYTRRMTNTDNLSQEGSRTTTILDHQSAAIFARQIRKTVNMRDRKKKNRPRRFARWEGTRRLLAFSLSCRCFPLQRALCCSGRIAWAPSSSPNLRRLTAAKLTHEAADRAFTTAQRGLLLCLQRLALHTLPLGTHYFLAVHRPTLRSRVSGVPHASNSCERPRYLA